MSYEVLNTAGWTLDQLAPYMTGVLEQMGRLAKRFPKDVTTEGLFGELLTGKKTLWIVLKDGEFTAIGLSTVRVIDATGTRVATLCDMAGRDVKAFAPELFEAIDNWAAENNCSEIAAEGRIGWKQLLTEYGFRPHAILYRKTR